MPAEPEYRAFYEEKALTYPEHDATAVARYEKALAIADLAPGLSVLDVACKDAALLELLRASAPGVAYTGLDISERVIAKNQRDKPGARFLAADVMHGVPLPDKSFDRIFALEILEHLPEPMRLLQEARRLLKDDGFMLLSVPNPYYYMELVNELRSFPEDDGHLFAFRNANVRALVEYAGFHIDQISGTYFLVPKQLRGAFRAQKYWILKRVPNILACSRIYRCRAGRSR
jgi:SAM-dependent methyltransferase